MMLQLSDFISDEYLELNRHLHVQPRKFGQSGRKHVNEVLAVVNLLGITEILDYGCGQGTFTDGMVQQGWRGTIRQYDPAVPGSDTLPLSAPLIVCTDVLEHVEPDKFDAVLTHLKFLTEQLAFFAISTVPSNKNLRDGRNAHLIVQPPRWWASELKKRGFAIASQYVRFGDDGPADVHFWLRP